MTNNLNQTVCAARLPQPSPKFSLVPKLTGTEVSFLPGSICAGIPDCKDSNTHPEVSMDSLKNRILADGEIYPGGIIKVDSFLNHQMDVSLIDEIGQEFHRRFGNCGVTKILTVEASGIGIACLTARYFGVPVVFAKKSESKNLAGELYTADVFSYTKGRPFTIRVGKRFLTADDRVLLIDDFLANGKALLGLIEITKQAGATVCGAGICIEKAFQNGGDIVRGMGIDLYSLAIVDVDNDGKIVFIER